MVFTEFYFQNLGNEENVNQEKTKIKIYIEKNVKLEDWFQKIILCQIIIRRLKILVPKMDGWEDLLKTFISGTRTIRY